MSRRLLVVIATSFSLGPALADPKSDHALNNLQQEALNCAAFHGISQAAFQKMPGNQGTEAAARSAEQVRAFVTLAFGLSKRLGQTKEGLMARSDLSREGLEAEMGHNFSNYSVLLSKYLEPCNALLSEPEGRLNYWLNESQK